jgi:polar amino acid transport system substrate-binding protein
MTRRQSLASAFVALLAIVASGCSGGGSSTSSVGRAPAAVPAAGPTTTAPPPPACGDATASLRPAGPLPAPRQMPTGSYMQKIRDQGRLIVGVDQNTLLFGSLNPFTGQIEGFDIDMLHQVADAIFGDPNAIEYRAITSAQRIPEVQSGDVDIVARTMTINCARLQQVLFSTVYYRAGQKVLVPSDSKVKGIGDLRGRKVCAAAGSTSIDNIRNAPSHPAAVVVDDWTDCLVALQRNQVDAISTDDAILAGLAAQDPYTKVVGPRFTDEPYGMAINKAHPEFVQFVNSVLDRMRADGTWAAIYAKWLAARLGPQSAPPATYSS